MGTPKNDIQGRNNRMGKVTSALIGLASATLVFTIGSKALNWHATKDSEQRELNMNIEYTHPTEMTECTDAVVNKDPGGYQATVKTAMGNIELKDSEIQEAAEWGAVSAVMRTQMEQCLQKKLGLKEDDVYCETTEDDPGFYCIDLSRITR